MLHGRLLGALMAHAVERDHGEPDLQVTRLTVDLFRNTPLAPVTVSTTRIRDGRRIRVVEAEVSTLDGPAAHAVAVLLRRGPAPAGEVPSTPAWSVPAPERLGPPRSPARAGRQLPWDIWLFDEDGTPLQDWTIASRRAWLRDRHPLVPGTPLTPLVRAALAADFASPVAHAGSAGLQYINADYGLYLSRLPAGDHIGVEYGGHLAEDGVAVGTCTLHDEAGPIGFCAVSAVANPNDPGERRRRVAEADAAARVR